MPTYQTTLYGFVDDSTNEMEDIYNKLAGRLEVVIEPAIFKKISVQVRNQVLAEVGNIISDGKEQTTEILFRILPKAFNLGIQRVNQAIPSLKKEDLSPGHALQINALLDDANFDFGTGLEGVKKAAGQILNRVYAEQIRDTIAGGRVLGESAPNLAKTVLAQLKEQGFVTFVRRDGHPIPLVDYAKMLTRTHLIRTSNEGIITRALQLGLTIFEASSHIGTLDKACKEIEGKLYDLTGVKYPKPPNLPIHPNCRHILQPRPDLS